MADETLGELSRRLDRLEVRTEKQLSDLDVRCNQRASTHVDSQLYAAERNHMTITIADLTGEIKELKGHMTWLWRAAVTGIAFPIITGIVIAIVLAYRGSS